MNLDKWNNIENVNLVNQRIFFDNIKENMLIKAREILRDNFEKIDRSIRNSYIRKKSGWYIHDKKERTVISSLGKITFFRTRFRNKYTNENRMLADDEIGILPYKKVLFELKERIFEEIGNGNRYSDIVKSFKEANISERTICNILKQFNLEDDFLDYIPDNKIDIKNEEILYIDTDDTFLPLRVDSAKKQCRIRLATLYTSQKKGLNDKEELVNKRTYIHLVKKGSNIATKKYWLNLLTFIRSNYKNWEHCKVVVKGDGAVWIKNLSEFFGGYYIPDKFHLIARLRKILWTNKANPNHLVIRKVFNDIKFLFLSGNNYDELFAKIEECYSFLKSNNFLQVDKIKEFGYFKRYIKRNKEYIDNYYKLFDSRSHTEAQISHVIKYTLGYGRKIFSYDNFKKIMFIRMLRLNQIDITRAIFYNKILYSENLYEKNFNDNKYYSNLFDYLKYHKKDLNHSTAVKEGSLVNRLFLDRNKTIPIKKPIKI